MVVYPEASWRPLGTQTEPRLVKKHKIVLHTMVGSLGGTDSFFRSGGYSGVESHFGVGGDGTVYQWQDTERQADAQLEGNDDCISIETADHGPQFREWSGSNVPAWTDAQIEAIARIVAWACETHGIPCRLIDDTRDATRGVGYHRQGIDPYRDQGERYSTAFGKVCPGDRRVAQIPRVIGRANEILRGDDMPSPSDWTNADREAMRDIVESALRFPTFVKAPNGQGWNVAHAVSWLMSQSAGQRDALARVLANQKAIMAAQGVEVDEAALAAEIAAVLVPAVLAALPDLGLTEDQLEDAIRSVLGSLDDA